MNEERDMTYNELISCIERLINIEALNNDDIFAWFMQPSTNITIAPVLYVTKKEEVIKEFKTVFPELTEEQILNDQIISNILNGSTVEKQIEWLRNYSDDPNNMIGLLDCRDTEKPTDKKFGAFSSSFGVIYNGLISNNKIQKTIFTDNNPNIAMFAFKIFNDKWIPTVIQPFNNKNTTIFKMPENIKIKLNEFMRDLKYGDVKAFNFNDMDIELQEWFEITRSFKIPVNDFKGN
jgi:hypothetical protein